MNWKNEEYKFARHMVYWSARIVANLASLEGRRLPLAWVDDVFFQGIFDGLEKNEVPRTLMADLLGISPRSLRRRISSLTSYLQPTGLSMWTRIHEYCLQEPRLRQDIFRKYSSVSSEHLTTILNDMVDQQWLVLDEGGYIAVEVTRMWTDDELDGLLIFYGSEQLDVGSLEKLSQYMHVPLERLQASAHRIIANKKYSLNESMVTDAAIFEGFQIVHTMIARTFMRQKTHGVSLNTTSVDHLAPEQRQEFFDEIRALREQLNSLCSRFRPENSEALTSRKGTHIYSSLVYGIGDFPGEQP